MFSNSSKKRYRPEIDGLRAIAVIAVIINHFDEKILPGGYLGVDIFFVISGFVITSSLLSQKENSLKHFILNFYHRRIKRLFPALLLFVIVMGIMLSIFSPSPRESLFTGISAIFGFSNIYLLNTATDYFASANKFNGYLHTWSLGVEEQYYLFFPFILWFGNFCHRKKRPSRFSYFLLIFLAISSFFLYVIFNETHHLNHAYYLMPSRFWELCVGCLSFLFINSSNKSSRISWRPIPFVVFLGIIICLFIQKKFTIYSTLSIVLCSSVLLICSEINSVIYNLLKHNITTYIGKISYSLYLWHWGFLTLASLTIGINLYTMPAIIMLIIIASIISYHCVESPLRQNIWSPKKVIAFLYGFIASLFTLCTLYILSFPCYEKLYLANLLNLQSPNYLQTTWWKDKKTGKYLETCHVRYKFSYQLLEECLASNSNSMSNIYIIGDSHARNYMPAIKEEFSGDYSVHYMTMGYGCAFLPPDMASLKKYSKVHCTDYVENVSDFLLKNTKQGDIVFIGSRLDGRQWKQRRSTPHYINFIKKFASKLEPNNVSVVILDGTFAPRRSPEECIDYPWTAANYKKGCFHSVEKVKNAFAVFDNLAENAATDLSNLYYAPLRTGLCYNGLCGQKNFNNTPIWHDVGHITEAASKELAPLLHSILAKQQFYQK